MTPALPNTSESESARDRWLDRQERLIASLRVQPFLLVVRPSPVDLDQSDPALRSALLDQLATLEAAGLRHLELAWSPHPGWCHLLASIRDRCPSLSLGAASVVDRRALDDLEQLDLPYAMSPCWDPDLQAEARSRGVLVVPGVFSPTEVIQAIQVGCRLVKLFPAATLGREYWSRLRSPLGPLPFVIAAGGLAPADLQDWLKAGHDAVALGRSVVQSSGVRPELLELLQQSQAPGR